ncbi:GNAT family N-acetyltransferase [Tumebacillus permanentifrigoris]|uniref:Acetyltransferase (GNAT) family protein n=1 Tax=Tumebacillus permanentifrigoris TaxID=378543 RepID=A0A316DDR7_9BACL|nr:GNAT family N-acetyltransferase [Tumebacillus permanentifrigoris]PWK16361.1 acetyltransferase (GNAT) family protein [Tumebacillus permanentifrigoris]
MLHTVQKNREAYLPLLLLADPSEEMVRRYLPEGELYSWLTSEGETVGVLHLTSTEATVCEIRNIAVRDQYQGQGHGRSLLESILKLLRERGVEKVIVRTGNSSIGSLAFYQKFGFRIMEIDHDYFNREYQTPIFENGIRCQDQLLLARSL